MPQRLLIISFSPIATDARVLKQIGLFSNELSGHYEVHTVGYGPEPDGVASHVRVPDKFQIWRYSRRDLIARRYSHAYWNNSAVDFSRHALTQPDPNGNRSGSAAADAVADHPARDSPGGGSPVDVRSGIVSELQDTLPDTTAVGWDAVLANDIDAVGLALSLPSKHGVHADLHEYAPRVKEDVPRWRLFVAPFMRWMCREFVARANSVTTVSAGIADAYQREFGIQAAVVTNAAPFRDWRPVTTGSPIRLVHSGAALRDRHLEIMIDAVEAAQKSAGQGTAVPTETVPSETVQSKTVSDRSTYSRGGYGAVVPDQLTLDLFLTPNDPGYVSELRERAQRVPGVTVNDPVPYSELAEELHGFDVGVFVLPPVNFNYEWALPNKFFDYVQARLGVIIGPSPEMVRVLNEYGFGAVTEDFTATALARILSTLNADTVRKWKQCADRAAPVLASEPQLEVWARAIDRLMSGSGSAS